MSKVFESLNIIIETLSDDKGRIMCRKELDVLIQALQRLESIESSKPNEALKWLEHTGEQWVEHGLNDDVVQYKETQSYREIKQALIKSQEQEKVLVIIKEKKVSIFQLKCCKDVYEYNDLKFKDNEKLTQEEFNLLKGYFG